MHKKLFGILGIFLVVVLATNVVAAQDNFSITIEEPAVNAFVSGDVVHVSGTYDGEDCGIVVYSETAGSHRFTFNVATLEEDEWKATLHLANKSDVYDFYIIVNAGVFKMDDLPNASSLDSDWEKALASDTIVIQHGEKVEKGILDYIFQNWLLIIIAISVLVILVIIIIARIYYARKDKKDKDDDV